MLMTVLFYAIVISFALVLIAWSANEMMRVWQAGVLMGFIYAFGVLALLVRMVVLIVKGEALAMSGLMGIFTFVMAFCACYMHFRLVGTMMAPVSAILLLVAEMGQRYLPALSELLPLVDGNDQPWVGAAMILAVVGLGATVVYVILAVVTFFRSRRLNEDTNEMIARVTRKMPKVLSHLGWWTLLVLSFALGAYMLWCQTIFGVFWIWQPLFVMVAAAWLLVFVGKDMLMVR